MIFSKRLNINYVGSLPRLLQRITISNFALFSDVSLHLSDPFVVVTGETGAGKSLFIQSLRFLSGGKKPTTPPPDPEAPSMVSCFFSADLREIISTCSELDHVDIPVGSESVEVKRVLLSNGKSKVMLGDYTISQNALKVLMSHVMEVNAQHQHLDVLAPKHQTVLLDRFGGYDDLLTTVASDYRHWQSLLTEQKKWALKLAELDDREQLDETKQDLDKLNLDTLDFNALHQTQKRLQSRQTFLHACQTASTRIHGDAEVAACAQLDQAIADLGAFHSLYPQTQSITRMLEEALTNCQEALSELQGSIDDDYSADAEQLSSVEKTLSECYATARKYRQQPESLTAYYQSICDQLDLHDQCQQMCAKFSAEIDAAEKTFRVSAEQLSTQRATTAQSLSETIQDQLPALNLAHGIFIIKSKPDAAPSATGLDTIRFLFSGNPGIPVATLDQCASGGELARLALLLAASIPATHRKVMIFDEADVGVSGKTATMIGKLFKQLSQQHQIICLTHSPQVTACGLQHWHVEKEIDGTQTTTMVRELDADAHIAEVARLLSGMDISPESLASARQLCQAID